MKLAGLEIGSWAEWVGSAGTIAAVVTALWPYFFRRLVHSNLVFQFVLTSSKEIDLFRIKLEEINLRVRAEFFKIEVLECATIDVLTTSTVCASLSQLDFKHFTDAPQDYLITCFGESSDRNVIGDKLPITNDTSTQIFIVRMKGSTLSKNDKYQVASVYRKTFNKMNSKIEVEAVANFCEKNMNESDFNKMIASVLN